MRLIWPVKVANYNGTVTSINEDRIQYQRKADGRKITLKLNKKNHAMNILVKKNEKVVKNQIIASFVPIKLQFACEKSVSEEDYVAMLSNTSLSKRYTAAKALAFFFSPKIQNILLQKTDDPNEHIYVRREAAASLARQGSTKGYEFIKKCLDDEYVQNRLEAVIVLGEIHEDISCEILIDTLLDNQQNPEIRAGAAWAIGELRNRMALTSLIESFAAVEEPIRMEAARALAKLGTRFSPEIINQFPGAHPAKRAGISWALSKAGKIAIQDVLDLLVDDDARQWVAYIVGTQDQEKYIHEIENLKKRDPEVYFAVTVLWKIMTSWIWELEEYL